MSLTLWSSGVCNTALCIRVCVCVCLHSSDQTIFQKYYDAGMLILSVSIEMISEHSEMVTWNDPVCIGGPLTCRNSCHGC